jgi:hypothetical protein
MEAAAVVELVLLAVQVHLPLAVMVAQVQQVA